MSDHGTHYKRPFPSNARGIFPRAPEDALRYARPMPMFTDDPVRVLVAARARQLELDLANLSRAMGQNGSYLQQFLRRGTPRVLPEDKREALAPLLGLSAEALRGAVPGKGGPRPADNDAIAVDPEETAWLRLLREIPVEKRPSAFAIVKALIA